MNARENRPTLQLQRLLPYLRRSEKPGESIHQGILNVAYDEWQKNPSWNYTAIVHWMGEQFGELAKFAVLIGKYNEQLLNGGHAQYYDNGYSGQAERGSDPDCPLHWEMTDILRRSCFSQTEVGCEVYKILRRFRLEESSTEDCSECDGGGSCNEDCETCKGEGDIDGQTCGDCHGSGSQEETCGCCHGAGTVVNSDQPGIDESLLEELDDAYYALSEQLMTALESYFEYWVQRDQDPLEELTPQDQQPIARNDDAKPKLKLIGTDGNVFSIIGRACDSMRKAGCSKEEIEDYRQKALSGNYDNVLATTLHVCDVS